MRATKYTDGTRAKLLKHIRDGRTVKDACSLVGISDMTLSRWRRRFSDFDAEYLEAVRLQELSVNNLKKSGVRTYRRSATKLQQEAEKQAEKQKIRQEVEEAKQNDKPLVYDGLRLRYGTIADDHPMEPCINASNGAVEYLKPQGGHLVQFSLSLDVFKRKYPALHRELTARNSVYNVGD
ncbi:helix-turn-helix domain-containing protein [Candidatus Saccharibacteria bacterium]|nr:helix-turn-helix domain-containing protein [Candidatus Saccharibacteria bacterium]